MGKLLFMIVVLRGAFIAAWKKESKPNSSWLDRDL